MGLISPTSKWVLPVNHISFLPSKSSGRFLGCNVAPSRFSPYFSAKIFTEASEKVNTLRNICHNQVPEYILQRAEEIGFMVPTDVQQQSLPILLSGKDCILHSQTGSGKTLAYLLSIFSIIDTNRSAVQALIVVPTRELGIQVTKVARMLAAAGPRDNGSNPKACTIMSLLDGGMLKDIRVGRTPEIVVATIGSLCQMIEKHIFKLEAIRILVIDEVDFMFNSSNEVQSLKKLLTSYSSINNRQTVFASASIPQHKRFLYDCIQQKWTKNDVVHIHTNAAEPMPSQLRHKFVIAHEKERFQTLLTLLERDLPKSCIIFVNEQSEKSKKAGKPPNTTHVIEVLNHAKEEDDLEILLLEENMNFHTRTATFLELRKGRCILVATDIASRGVDLPEITHIYNFNLPKTAVDYLHRAGRTGRKPFSDEKCSVTSLITPEERFALQRFENELSFQCERLDFITEPI